MALIAISFIDGTMNSAVIGNCDTIGEDGDDVSKEGGLELGVELREDGFLKGDVFRFF